MSLEKACDKRIEQSFNYSFISYNNEKEAGNWIYRCAGALIDAAETQITSNVIKGRM